MQSENHYLENQKSCGYFFGKIIYSKFQQNLETLECFGFFAFQVCESSLADAVRCCLGMRLYMAALSPISANASYCYHPLIAAVISIDSCRCSLSLS